MIFDHPLVRAADEFACRAHESIGQIRKYTGEPYIVHPRAVAAMLAEHINDPEVIAAALLHDVLEDTPVKSAQIESAFGSRVAGFVKALSDVPEQPGLNREARKQSDIARLAEAGFEVQSIKLADLTHNTESIVRFDHRFARTYLEEKARVLAVLDKGHPLLLERARSTLASAREALHAMGGNALKATTIRLARQDYLNLESSTLGTLRAAYPGRIDAIQSYATKPDFGDMDLLVEAREDYDMRSLAEQLQATEVTSNRSRDGKAETLSVGIHTGTGIFQVNLIRVPSASFEFACHYFAMNDLGSLIGAVATRAGFTLSHLGLFYKLHAPGTPDQVIASIPVTKNWFKAITFLGYSANRFRQGMQSGFRTPEDIYAYVASGKYFSEDLHSLESRNLADQARKSAHPLYMGFLAWLDQRSPLARQYDWNETTLIEGRAHSRQDLFLRIAREAFLGFNESCEAALQAHHKEAVFRIKFNANLVKRITGLEDGPQLGHLMRDLTETAGGRDALRHWVCCAEQEEIRSFICDTFASTHQRRAGISSQSTALRHHN